MNLLFHALINRCNILMIPEIPSRYHSGKEYKVAIMYIPTDRPQRFGNWMGYRYIILFRVVDII